MMNWMIIMLTVTEELLEDEEPPLLPLPKPPFPFPFPFPDEELDPEFEPEIAPPVDPAPAVTVITLGWLPLVTVTTFWPSERVFTLSPLSSENVTTPPAVAVLCAALAV